MKKEAFHGLVSKYVAGTASEAEIRLLEAYYTRLEGRYDPLPADQEERLRKEMLERIMEEAGIPRTRVVSLRYRMVRYSAAAAVVLGVCVGGYRLLVRPAQPVVVEIPAGRFKNDVQPGGNKATLTLAGGSVIDLDSAQHGALATQGNSRVIKLNDSVLTYAPAATGSEAIGYNTLATPKGGQYLLVLPDGSKVWLNAASSITYPTAFTGKERVVTMTGEAYFEVSKNASQPFKVGIPGKEEVEVLGTSFNVNAYNDEPEIKTTLLEGSVKVKTENLVGVNTNKEKLSVVLKPGQQAEIANSVVGAITNNDKEQIKVVHSVDVEEVMAWKNGLFRFNDVGIRTIMQQAARWYDVQIEYQTSEKLGFVATISRNVPVSKLLQLLELTDRVHFKVDGKKITVLP
jgi:transmembrane sensor